MVCRISESILQNWKDELHLLLQGRDGGTGEDARQIFRELMERAKQAKEYDKKNYEELEKVVRNDVLLYLLNEYIEEIKECDLIMEEIRQRENGEKLLRHFKRQ